MLDQRGTIPGRRFDDHAATLDVGRDRSNGVFASPYGTCLDLTERGRLLQDIGHEVAGSARAGQHSASGFGLPPSNLLSCAVWKGVKLPLQGNTL